MIALFRRRVLPRLQSLETVSRDSTPTIFARPSMAALDRARDLLGARLRVEISAGRSFEGELACLDHNGNLMCVAAPHRLADLAVSSMRTSKAVGGSASCASMSLRGP